MAPSSLHILVSKPSAVGGTRVASCGNGWFQDGGFTSTYFLPYSGRGHAHDLEQLPGGVPSDQCGSSVGKWESPDQVKNIKNLNNR